MTSAYWELFTNSVFDGPLLRFVATQPEAVALGPWNAFKNLYAPALLLAIGIVLFAASFHVRRTLRPIHALVDATRRIASGDFTARAEIRRNDEFADLAHAMNRMAAGLNRQFDTMRMLAQIDRLILTGASIDQVVQRVLQHLARLLPGQSLGIVVAERESAEAARLQVARAGDTEIRAVRQTLPAHALDDLAAHRHGKTVMEPAADPVCQALASPGVDRVLVVPLLARERAVGALLIGLGAAPALDDAQLHSVRDFTGRLAVALEAVERESELLRRANYDELTKLPNRQLLLDRLEQALIQARHAAERLLVLFVDLDRFKTVNDSFGHTAGDGLLCEASARLRAAVGESITVARLGGDEFVVLLPRPQGMGGESVAAIDRILAEMSRPFRIGASEVFLSASIGVAAFPDDGETADELLRKADTAMYGAKDAGRAQALFYSADMSHRIRHKLNTEAQLRHALEREEFRVAFQPQLCLRTNRVVAAEALLRWSHPGRGAVPPAEFIPIAEETGYITILGAWAMHQACAQVGRWRRAGAVLDQIAVNVSVRQFRQAGFAQQVEECLARTGLPPQTLLLELTESIFVHDLQSARQLIGQLKEIGVSIAIDDFGTGYSSLGYLKQLSFDQVKIDRAFVKDLPDDQAGNAIVNAVVAMSHTLGKPVIAEGIETGRQLEHLKKVGVDLGQGFLLGKPVFAEDFPIARADGTRVA
jgi:diguanylate cyclase (GGDEF)-like protein